MKMIDTDKCTKCIFSIINEENKAKIIVHCNVKNKDYSYGQRIPCDKFKKKG